MISDKIKFGRLFNGLESYMASLLDYWHEKETLKYFDLLDDMTGDAGEIVFTMTEIIYQIDKSDEIAIRTRY